MNLFHCIVNWFLCFDLSRRDLDVDYGDSRWTVCSVCLKNALKKSGRMSRRWLYPPLSICFGPDSRMKTPVDSHFHKLSTLQRKYCEHFDGGTWTPPHSPLRPRQILRSVAASGTLQPSWLARGILHKATQTFLDLSLEKSLCPLSGMIQNMKIHSEYI